MPRQRHGTGVPACASLHGGRPDGRTGPAGRHPTPCRSLRLRSLSLDGPRGPHRPQDNDASSCPAPPPSPAAPLAPPEPAAATEPKRRGENIALALFIAVPFLALLAAVPVAWGWGLGWRDLALAVVFYAVAGHGITVGFHRYFTHGSFKANRPLRDRAGRRRLAGHRGPGRPLGRRPPQAPRVQRPGRRPALALALRRDRARADQGPLVAHMGWLFDVEQTTAASTRPTC